MAYAGRRYGGAAFGGGLAEDIPTQTDPILAVEIAFATGALETPVWEPVTADVRSWNVSRGRRRELERFQPGRATIVLDNRERQYDSNYSAGPHFGNLKPMRRIRIRETFNGVTYPTFDGFVDKWQLDYPATGKDATATIIATDAFKIFTRTDLPRSVYDDLILSDSPELYWRLDETKTAAQDSALTALNAGTLSSAADGTYVGPPALGGQRLVVADPSPSMEVTSSVLLTGTEAMGVLIDGGDFDIFGGSTTSFVFEAWCLPTWNGLSNIFLMDNTGTSSSGTSIFLQVGSQFEFQVTTDAGVFDVNDDASSVPHRRYHLVCKFVSGESLKMWVNGTLYTGDTPTGSVDLGADLQVGYTSGGTGDTNWIGNVSHVAVWRGAAAEAFGATEVAAHLEAGTAPWNADQPDDRIDRVLDIVDWSDGLRELDDGDVALQSATLETTALEHLQKVGETEFGLLFMSRDGKVRLVDRAAQFARQPAPQVIGDGSGEVPYRDIKFDDGDSVIRNRATIGQLNGVPAVSVDSTSVTEFGRFDYSLDGLLHDSLTYSSSYADFIVAEYKDPRRRVVSLDLGPADDAAVYEQMLGRELGDAVTVKNRPPGGGDAFEQVCVIEGTEHNWSPKVRTTRWMLSPEFSTSF